MAREMTKVLRAGDAGTVDRAHHDLRMFILPEARWPPRPTALLRSGVTCALHGLITDLKGRRNFRAPSLAGHAGLLHPRPLTRQPVLKGTDCLCPALQRRRFPCRPVMTRTSGLRWNKLRLDGYSAMGAEFTPFIQWHASEKGRLYPPHDHANAGG